MSDFIEKILKTGRSIQPSENLRARTRGVILSSHRNSWISIIKNEVAENFKFTVALALTTILILLVAGGLSYEKIKSARAPGVNGNELLREVEKLDFQIQLSEIRYFDESAKEVALILDEINEAEPESLDRALDQIIF